MCNWSAWWFDEQGDVPAANVAATIAEFALRAMRSDRPRARASSAEAIEQMRDALAVLETGMRKPKAR